MRDSLGRFVKGHKLSEEIKGKLRLANLGRKPSEETKKKLSEAFKGRIFSKEWKRKISIANKGRKHSEETKEKIRKRSLENPSRYWKGKKRPDISELMKKIQKGRKLSPERKRKALLNIQKHQFKNGFNHKNWKGGKSRNKHTGLKYQNWRKSVYERDDFTCQKCKERSRIGKRLQLEAHHIKRWIDFPRLRYVVSNGITFCFNCHKQFHKLRKGNLNDYLKEMPSMRTISFSQPVD